MQGQDTGTSFQSDPKLVGEVTEVHVNNVLTTALCDTGSCVSTVSEKFYSENCSNVLLKPLQDIWPIECANGEDLPNKGYIEVNIQTKGIPGSSQQTCLLLVVPDTEYNQGTPILLGTNVLSVFLNSCKEQHGEKSLQCASLQILWFLAFRCMVLRETELKNNNDRLAVLRCDESQKFVLKS